MNCFAFYFLLVYIFFLLSFLWVKDDYPFYFYGLLIAVVSNDTSTWTSLERLPLPYIEEHDKQGGKKNQEVVLFSAVDLKIFQVLQLSRNIWETAL